MPENVIASHLVPLNSVKSSLSCWALSVWHCYCSHETGNKEPFLVKTSCKLFEATGVVSIDAYQFPDNPLAFLKGNTRARVPSLMNPLQFPWWPTQWSIYSWSSVSGDRLWHAACDQTVNKIITHPFVAKERRWLYMKRHLCLSWWSTIPNRTGLDATPRTFLFYAFVLNKEVCWAKQIFLQIIIFFFLARFCPVASSTVQNYYPHCHFTQLRSEE